VVPGDLQAAQDRSVGQLRAAYPTLGEASKRGQHYFTDKLFGPATRRLVRLLARLPV
jgi:hypothetical protein